jgi:hypothetical protein
MAVERFYIYRSAASNACALTLEKCDSGLPANSWRFWMQVARHQSEDNRYGFNWEVAVAEIATKGYYLFTGSSKLLDARVRAQSATGPINV